LEKEDTSNQDRSVHRRRERKEPPDEKAELWEEFSFAESSGKGQTHTGRRSWLNASLICEGRRGRQPQVLKDQFDRKKIAKE